MFGGRGDSGNQNVNSNTQSMSQLGNLFNNNFPPAGPKLGANITDANIGSGTRAQAFSGYKQPNPTIPLMNIPETNLPFQAQAGTSVGAAAPAVPKTIESFVGSQKGVKTPSQPGNVLEQQQLSNAQKVNPIALGATQRMAGLAGVPGYQASQQPIFGGADTQAILNTQMRTSAATIDSAAKDKANQLMQAGMDPQQAQMVAQQWATDEKMKARLGGEADLRTASLGKQEQDLAQAFQMATAMQPDKLTTSDQQFYDQLNTSIAQANLGRSQGVNANNAGMAFQNAQTQYGANQSLQQLQAQLSGQQAQNNFYGKNAQLTNQASMDQTRDVMGYQNAQNWMQEIFGMLQQQNLAEMNAAGLNRVFDWGQSGDLWKALQGLGGQYNTGVTKGTNVY